MEKQISKTDESLRLDSNYTEFLSHIKERLKTAQLRAARAVNQQLVLFYWELGKELIEKQKSFKWGNYFIEQFSRDMRIAFPEIQGFSKRNLEYMRQLAILSPNPEFAKQAVSQLPWGHVVVLIQKIKNPQIQEWYAQQAIKYGWSRAILGMQIETQLYERQAIADQKISNFHEHLPKAQSDLANEMLKDPYSFDFLTIQGEAHERVVEDALITHMRDFLLELGQGFAFVGSQVPLTFDDQEFFMDLLFYHLHLRCFIVVELKATKFKPEHTGQLGFYMAVVDDQYKKEFDNPTIGILLCKSKNKVVAEYALKGSKAPIGISEYTLSKALPTELKTSLPTVEELEAELNQSVAEEHASALD
jgi:predicted nuclease of restriction endonuclease-like (RecB) superfamily